MGSEGEITAAQVAALYEKLGGKCGVGMHGVFLLVTLRAENIGVLDNVLTTESQGHYVIQMILAVQFLTARAWAARLGKLFA